MAQSKPKKIKKIWVAMSTPFQANFFAPLIKGMENEYEFLGRADVGLRAGANLIARRAGNIERANV